MESRFSGALQITNLDDFITPSQECIKPLEIKKPALKTGAKITIQDDGDYVEHTEQGSHKLEKVEITLADCLACSGCITSAEGVLVSQQSQEELLRVFNEKKALVAAGSPSKFIVVSLSIQPVLSIAQRYSLHPDEAAKRISGYFRSLGADLVLDMTVAEDLALLESAKEFISRFQASQTQKQLPMLASSCPGWICYAEKTHGNFILPYISATKSPQQIMGSMVKSHIAEIHSLSAENIYHVTLMPCYDKKLEASRENFYNKLKETRDVDCVITSIEFEQMLDNQKLILGDLSVDVIDRPLGGYSEHENINLWSHEGSGSGGYADFIFRYAAKQLFSIDDAKLELRALRNPDFSEAILERNGQILLRFAIVNGFRNIQNLVQKLKRDKCPYHYVEVMACPAGCLNGGAQIRPQNGEQPRELASILEAQYHALPAINPELNPIVHNLYGSWLNSENSENSSSFLHTEYNAIEKTNFALTMKW